VVSYQLIEAKTGQVFGKIFEEGTLEITAKGPPWKGKGEVPIERADRKFVESWFEDRKKPAISVVDKNKRASVHCVSHRFEGDVLHMTFENGDPFVLPS